MEVIRVVREARMVAEYLSAEIDSSRFGPGVRDVLASLGLDEELVRNPDVENDQENAARAEALGRSRGYGRDSEMFAGVPTDLVWLEALLSPAEVGELRYVDYSYWNELTSGSHLVRDGVEAVRAGLVVLDVPNDRVLVLAQDISDGRIDPGPLIAWGSTADRPLELLEGHLRATAYGLAGRGAPKHIRAIIGLTDPPPYS